MTNSLPLISVVICTQNRRVLLQQAIISLQHQSFSADKIEIIVVDNKSSDGTQELVERMSRTSSVEIRFFREERLGVSFARNTGLDQARGVYIAYLDDDEQASVDWVQSIIDTFSTVSPEPGIVCGPVYPHWEKQRPPWMIDDYLSVLSILTPPLDAGFTNNLGWDSFPEGNAAFRTNNLRRVGGFPTSLGRRGNLLISSEGEIVEKNLRAMGLGLYFHPLMSVQHFVPAGRVTVRWLSRRCFWESVTDAILRLNANNYTRRHRAKLIFFYLMRIFPELARAAWMRISTLIFPQSQELRIRYVAIRLELSSRMGLFYGFLKHSIFPAQI